MNSHLDLRRQFNRHRRGAPVAVLSAFVALVFVSPVTAQYEYDPAAADEQGVPGIRYFGSAKDDKGTLLPGVTVLLDGDQFSYVFVTNDQGRFQATLPLDTLPEKVMAKCWKVGLQIVRIDKRPGPSGSKPSVQVDCVLRSTTTG